MSGPGRRAPLRLPHGWSAIAIVVALLALNGVAPARPAGPACSFAASLMASPTGGVTPLLVRFNATVSGGTPSAFDWNFGDGSYWNASGASAATPLHRYATPGTFPVAVVAVEGGCGATATATIVVSSGPVLVVISASPTAGPAPLRVQFNISITGGTGTYASAAWSFGDGGAGLGTGLSYTYLRPGSFTARVVVTDSDAVSGNASVPIEARGPTSATSGWLPWAVGGVAAVIALGAVGGWTVRSRHQKEAGSTHAPEPAPSEPPADPLSVAAPSQSTTRAVGPVIATPSLDAAGAISAADPSPSALDSAASPPAERRLLSRLVLLHIGAQGRLGPDEVAPLGLTQTGMAQALQVGQNSLTNVLRRLVAAGVLTQDLRHVQGQARRLRVYRLTARGESLYADVRRRREPRADPPRD